MARQAHLEAFSPFRRYDWRFERVLQMVDRYPTPGRSTRRDDTYVKGLRNFILRYRNYDDTQRNQLAYENLGLYYAYQLRERSETDSSHLAEIVEARLLAGQNDEQIAHEISTIPETVEWYEALYFNIRDRRGNGDWISQSVLVPAYMKKRNPNPDEATALPPPISEPFFDGTLKFYAYFGGPYILDYVLTGFRRGVPARSSEEIGLWFDQHYTARIKYRSSMAAQTFEVNRYTVMQLFEINNQIMNIERTTDKAEHQQDLMHKIMGSLMKEMQWATGMDGSNLVAGTALAAYDSGAAELRDGETMQVARGDLPGTIEEVPTLKLPPPKRKTGQEDPQHANIKQGS